tara:strand:+ start:1689 stop:2465 length:777 start_codon:yes stop_codon:yes gene_type:complete
MIDFHNHVLPDVDDGSKSMEMTLDMLKSACNQGIKKVVNTVHFQHPKMEGKNTDYNYISDIRDQVLVKAKEEGIDIEIDIASEVYYNPNLCDIIDNPITTFNKYMLVEFSPMIVPHQFLDTFFNLRMEGITPILAHPERYRFVQEDVSKLNKMKDLDVVFQIDAGSLIGHFGRKTMQTAFSMVYNGYCHIIGSDAHNNARRNFCISEAYDILSSFDRGISNKLIHNSNCIIDGKKDFKSIKLEKLNFFQKLKKKISKT